MTGQRSVNLIGKCSTHETQPRADRRRRADALRRRTRRRHAYYQSRIDQRQYGREGGLAGGFGRTLVQDRALDRVDDHGKALVRNCNGGSIVIHWPCPSHLRGPAALRCPPWGPVLASAFSPASSSRCRDRGLHRNSRRRRRAVGLLLDTVDKDAGGVSALQHWATFRLLRARRAPFTRREMAT